MAVTGVEPISAANLSAAIAGAKANVLASANAYADQAVQALRNEINEIPNSYYSVTLVVAGHGIDHYLTVDRQNETSSGGVSASYEYSYNKGNYVDCTFKASKTGVYVVSIDGTEDGRFNGSGSYQKRLSIPSNGYKTYVVLVTRIA